MEMRLSKKHAEADAFFCFNILMSEIMNNFCKTLDSSQVGIKGQMRNMNLLLKQKDPELWIHLENLQLDPQYYSFRWITLLLSQEFELPDVFRLWDSLFAETDRFNLLLHVCVSMMIALRDQLLPFTFAEALKLLQKYPPTDIGYILSLAHRVMDPNYKASDFILPEDKLTLMEQGSSVIDSIFGAIGSFKFY